MLCLGLKIRRYSHLLHIIERYRKRTGNLIAEIIREVHCEGVVIPVTRNCHGTGKEMAVSVSRDTAAGNRMDTAAQKQVMSDIR